MTRGCQVTPVPGWHYVDGCWTPPWLLLPSSPSWWTSTHIATVILAGLLAVALVVMCGAEAVAAFRRRGSKGAASLGAVPVLAASGHHATPTTNVAGWIILIALIALGIWGLARWIRN